jgi:hypothetical protein
LRERPSTSKLETALSPIAVLYLLISETQPLLPRKKKDAKPIQNILTAVVLMQIYPDRNIISQNIKNIAADNQTMNSKQLINCDQRQMKRA